MYQVDSLATPSTLDEALDLIARDEGRLPLAGGTDLLVKLRNGQLRDVHLVSLSEIGALKGIWQDEAGDMVIGAMATFTAIAEHPLIMEKVPMLKTAALSMGGPQVRNAATLGGNICNGATSADGAPALFALDAVLELHSKKGERRLPITAFYSGPGKTVRERDELLTAIHLPIGKLRNWAGVYIKHSTRKAMDISTLGAASVCELDENKTIRRAAISLGTAGPTPVRCTEAEAILTGRVLTENLLEEAGKLSLFSANPRSSWRADKRYRELLIEELAARSFLQAFELAGGILK